jgi:hypothetical protein
MRINTAALKSFDAANQNNAAGSTNIDIGAIYDSGKKQNEQSQGFEAAGAAGGLGTTI